MTTQPRFSVEYIDPLVAAPEPLPDESPPRGCERSLLMVGAIVRLVVAVIVLVPG